jgi:uncharacterized protein (DUF4415 family)
MVLMTSIIDLGPAAPACREMTLAGGALMAPTRLMMAAGSLAVLAACVQVRAPDKPIEINLNVNIKQEVTVRLEKDVQDLVKSNPGVF